MRQLCLHPLRTLFYTFLSFTQNGTNFAGRGCTDSPSPDSSNERSRVKPPGLLTPESREEFWSEKEPWNTLEEEIILEGQDEKVESTQLIKPSPVITCFSHSLSMRVMDLTKESTPPFANLHSSSKGSWAGWKNAKQLWSLKSTGCKTWKV